jgi:hypothetical protein
MRAINSFWTSRAKALHNDFPVMRPEGKNAQQLYFTET